MQPAFAAELAVADTLCGRRIHVIEHDDYLATDARLCPRCQRISRYLPLSVVTHYAWLRRGTNRHLTAWPLARNAV